MNERHLIAGCPRILPAFALSLAAAVAEAETTTRTSPGSGNWHIPANWTNGVPAASVAAPIGNAWTAEMFVIPSVPGPAGLLVASVPEPGTAALLQTTTKQNNLN